MVFSKRLATAFMALFRREVDERFDRAPSDAERDGTKAGGDARMRGYLISRCGQDDRVAVEGRKAGWNEAIVHHHVVTSRATQAADRPCVDDVAVRGRAQHEPVLRRSRWCSPGLPVLVPDAQEHEPGAELTSADEGPAPAHTIATIDDRGTSAWSCTVRQDHVRLAEDELRDILVEAGRGPVNIGVPAAPRDRCIGARELLVDVDRLEWIQVETSIGGGQEDSEEAGACQLACEIVGQAPIRVDPVALRQNSRPKRLRGLEERGDTVTNCHCRPPCWQASTVPSPIPRLTHG